MGYHQLTKERYDLARSLEAAGASHGHIAGALGLTIPNTKYALETSWKQILIDRQEHRNKYKTNPKDKLQTMPPVTINGVDLDKLADSSERIKVIKRPVPRFDAEESTPTFEPATKQDIAELKDFIVKHFKGKKVRWIG